MRDYLDMVDLVSPTEKIRYIADHYGLKEQLAQTREECAELIVATSKFDRAKTDQDKLIAIEKITEEMADVSIMLQQLKYLLNNRLAFQYGVQNKLDRQIRRIRDEMNWGIQRMNKRDYALISTGETNDFENSVLPFLRDWPGEKPPKSYVLMAVPEAGDVDEAGAVIYTWRATLDDMIRMKGHLELQIQHESLLENLGVYIQAAWEEGLLPCQCDPDDQIDPEDDQIDSEDEPDEPGGDGA